MQSNSAVARKWSIPRSTTSCASGRASVNGSGGPAKSRSPMTTSVGHVTRAASVGVNGSEGRRRHAADRERVVARAACELYEEPGREVVGIGARTLFEHGRERTRVVGTEHVRPDADHDKAAETFGRARRDAQE